jgi:phosphoribosyl 1,2-cyclic phosphate phosphodiesterase
MNDLERVYRYAFKSKFTPGYFKPKPHLIHGEFLIGDLKITPFEQEHGNMGSLGFLFEQGNNKQLAYYNDCKKVSPDAINAAAGVELAILDALRPTEHHSHMTLDEALTTASKIGAKETLLTHLTDFYDHDRDSGNLPNKVLFAYDGLKRTI